MRALARLIVIAVLFAPAAASAAVRPLLRVDVARDPRPAAFAIAATPTRSFLVAWRGLRDDGSPAPVHARLYQIDGHPTSSALALGGVGGSGVRVVPGADGSYWVVYATATKAVVARRVTRHGAVDGRPIVLLPATPLLLAFQAEGSFDGGLVVWEHRFDDTGNHETLRAFDRTGAPRGPGWTVLGGDPSTQLAVAPSGESLLVMEAIDSDGRGSHLYSVIGQRFDRTGAPVGEPMDLTPPLPEGYWGGDFDVTSSGETGFLVTWLEQGVGGYIAHVRTLGADGTLGDVHDAGSRPGMRPIVPTPEGGFVVAWNTFFDGDYTPLAAVQRHAESGAATSVPLLLEGPPYYIGFTPALASDLAGDYYAVWWARGRNRDSDVLRVLVWRYDDGN